MLTCSGQADEIEFLKEWLLQGRVYDEGTEEGKSLDEATEGRGRKGIGFAGEKQATLLLKSG